MSVGGVSEVTVYTLPDCVKCRVTVQWFERYFLTPRVESLQDHPDVLDTAVDAGWRTAPVVVVRAPDGSVEEMWGDLDPDLILRWAARIRAQRRAAAL